MTAVGRGCDISECTDWLRDRVRGVRGQGDGGQEEGEDRDQESGEPCASTVPVGGTTTKSQDVEHDLRKEDQPEECERDEQEAKQCAVAVPRSATPLGEHDVGEQDEVNRHGDALQGRGDAS
jgi:hypothetical protein